MNNIPGLEFNDVLISPIPSNVNSRSEVDISVKLSDNLKLDFPLIASPMRGIVNAKFAMKLSSLGGLAILHRFYDTEEEWFHDIKLMLGSKFGISIGLDDPNYEKMIDFSPDILLVDVANGYTKHLLEFCDKIKNEIVKRNNPILLMSGNVATYRGVENLKNSGVDIVRVGIGSGGLCSTRNVTGIGVPQLSALLDCSQENDVVICADGGITSSGDFVKAIVAGADFAMAGTLFAQTFESANDGVIYGMASKKLQEMKYTQIRSIEGIEKNVSKRITLKQFIDEFVWGIRSAGTYLNAKNLNEIAINGEFVLSGKGSIKDI